MPTRPPAVSGTTDSAKSGAQEIERWHNPFSMLSQEESGKIFNRPGRSRMRTSRVLHLSVFVDRKAL
jgi:hypothetical protein